jgi:hypothetical protein
MNTARGPALELGCVVVHEDALKGAAHLHSHGFLGMNSRTAPMLGFKWFRTAASVIAKIGLPRRTHKGQFRLGGLRLEDRNTPAVWSAILGP